MRNPFEGDYGYPAHQDDNPDQVAALHTQIAQLQARIRELEQALENIRDYPHGTDNCCPMSEIAYAALHVADKP